MAVAEGPAVPLIRTKVHGPTTRVLVPRSALVQRLVHGPARRLTLIRGQAGWGKSSVLAAWSAADPRPFAWLSLDRGDNDPVRFFSYVVAALQTLTDGVGQRSTSIIRTPGVHIVDQLLPALINELDALPQSSVFVLEDYHAIDNSEVHDAVSYLVEHAPQSLEVVLSTRVEPPLPVSRLRGRAQLLEIAVSDLQFSIGEAHTLLVAHQGLALQPSDVERLVVRTEGWPAGLYLAALSLRGREDAREFIDAFAGDDRNIVDYLTTEVLAGQSAQVRSFMLSTSVLDRLCAPLCDEVVGGTGSAAMLKDIEKANSFLLALDNRREWYRYHHLFRELMRNELLSTDPVGAAVANRRAAAWLRVHGWASEAISHLVAAGDVEEAGELIASSWLAFATSGRHETVRAWLGLLPAAVHDGDSRLCVAGALTAIGTGRLDDVGRWIDQAARAPAGGPFHDGFRSGVAAADCLRTVHSWLLGDLGACRAAGEAAIVHAEESSPWDGVTYTWLGAAQFWLGNSEEGVSAPREGLERSKAAGFHPPWIASSACSVWSITCEVNITRRKRSPRRRWPCPRRWAWTSTPGSRLAPRSRGPACSPATERQPKPVTCRPASSRRLTAAAARWRSPTLSWRSASPRRPPATSTLGAPSSKTLDRRSEPVRTPDRSSPHCCGKPAPPVISRRAALLPAPLATDFSERETAVLRLLAGTLSQREIAGELFISFNTVKTHSKSIFRKLGVGTRADAVARARELDLIH